MFPAWRKRRAAAMSALLAQRTQVGHRAMSEMCQILTSYPCIRSVASSYSLANGVAFFGCIFCLR
jgi:hypothetical protein